ncbi:hypothetical protein KEM54_003513, partial [Ascosphaera aggregata]
MFFLPLILLLLSPPSSAANAPLTFDNAGTVIYEASLPNKSSTPIRGVLTGKAGPNQMGIRFHLRFWNLPDDEYILLLPPEYRIHTGQNCSSIGPLFDPYNSKSINNCDIRNPATWSSCAVGDLSGKHGPLPHCSYMTEYLDDYLSLNTANPAFFGDKLLLVHGVNGSVLNCAKFRLLEGSGVPVTVPFLWPSTLNFWSAGSESTLLSVSASASASASALVTGNSSLLHLSPQTGTAVTTTTTTTTTMMIVTTAGESVCRLDQTSPIPRMLGRLATTTAAAATTTTATAAGNHQPCIISSYPLLNSSSTNTTSTNHIIASPAKPSVSVAAMVMTDLTTAAAAANTDDTSQITSSPPIAATEKSATTSSTSSNTAHRRYPSFKHNSDSRGGAASSDSNSNSSSGKHVVSVLEMAVVGA